VSRVSRAWTRADMSERLTLSCSLLARDLTPLEWLRLARLEGRHRRFLRVRLGPRKAFRRGL